MLPLQVSTQIVSSKQTLVAAATSTLINANSTTATKLQLNETQVHASASASSVFVKDLVVAAMFEDLRDGNVGFDVAVSHLLLTADDRQGCIVLLDLHLSPVLWFDTDSSPSKLAIQDLAWVQARPDSYYISSISVYNNSTSKELVFPLHGFSLGSIGVVRRSKKAAVAVGKQRHRRR
ncbi:hypothetical protein ACFX1X_046222 [Malus domestica]